MLWSFVRLYAKMYTLKPCVFYIIIRVSFPIRTTPIKNLGELLRKAFAEERGPRPDVYVSLEGGDFFLCCQ